MQKLSDDEMQELLSNKFATFEVNVDRTMWGKVSSRIKHPGTAQHEIFTATNSIIAVALGWWLMTSPAQSFTQTPLALTNSQSQEVSSLPKQQEPLSAAPLQPEQPAPAQKTKGTKINPEQTNYPEAAPSLAYHEKSAPVNATLFAEQEESEDKLIITTEETAPKIEQGEITTADDDEVIPAVHKKRSAFGLAFTPMLGYKHVTPNRNDAVNITDFSSAPALSMDRFGYEVALWYGVPLRRGRLESGVTYLQYNSPFRYYEISRARESATEQEFNARMNGIGVRIDYQLRDAAQSPFVGVSWNVLTGNHMAIRGQSLLFGRAGYSFDIYHAGEFSVMLRPTVTYALNSANYNTLRLRPYTFGLTINVVKLK